MVASNRNAKFASALVLLTAATPIPALAAPPGFMMRETMTAVRSQPRSTSRWKTSPPLPGLESG